MPDATEFFKYYFPTQYAELQKLREEVSDLKLKPVASSFDKWMNFVIPTGDKEKDTENLQNALNFKGGDFRGVALSGFYRTSKILSIPVKIGPSITGTGFCTDVRYKPEKPAHGSSTVIQYAGQKGGTVLEYHGSGLSVDKLTIDGNELAEIGFHASYDGAMNPLKSDMKLAVHNCKTAIQLGRGETLREPGSDTANFGWLFMRNCEQGIRVCTEQSMNHSVQHWKTMFVKRPFVLEAGGRINIDEFETAEGMECFLTTGVGGIGKNNGSVWVRNISLDMAARDALILEMKDKCGIHLLIDGAHVASGLTTSPSFKLRPWGKLTLRNFYGLNKGAFQNLEDAGDKIVNVSIERSEIGRDLKEYIHPKSKSMVVSCRGCFTWTGEPVGNQVVKI